MKLVAFAFLMMFAACKAEEVDAPQCKQLLAHIYKISPETKAKLEGKAEADVDATVDKLVAALPPEDIAQCAAADPKVVACMQQAADIPAVRACIPAPKEE